MHVDLLSALLEKEKSGGLETALSLSLANHKSV
jgi:hypothetical protein